MRNTFLLFLTITTITVSGQNRFIGFKGGANRTNVTESNFFMKNRNYRTGLALGLTYDYIFKKYFSVSADIIYNQRGFTNKIIFTDVLGIPTGINVITKFNYDYVATPLKVGFNYGKSVYGFANIGLTPSILVNAKTITPAIDLNGTIIPRETSNVTGRVKKFDIGGLVEIGGGYKFKGKYWLFTSFSYQNSFTTITNSDYFSDSKIQHYGMTINLGMKCALTKE